MFFKKKNKEDNISTESKEKEKKDYSSTIIKEGESGTEFHCFIDLTGLDSKDKELSESKPEEKYIWVEGYKGTDKDMVCKVRYNPIITSISADGTNYRSIDYTKSYYNTQYYELNKEVSLKDDEEPVLCKKGFHFCLNLKDVFEHYKYNFSNRYFKVKAYVKERDYNSVKDSKDTKLAAKKIILYEEVFPEYKDIKKYLKYTYTTCNNTYTYQIPKELFEEIKKSDLSFNDFMYKYVSDEMINLGYSTTFTMLLVDKYKDDDGNLNIALAMHMYTMAKAFKEENISPDMSAYLLLNNKESK